MKFALKNIRPNPFRDFAVNPLNPETIEALIASYEAIGFSNNIAGRLTPDDTAELMYGHHRYEALMRKYGPDHVIDLIIVEANDAKMLRGMADDNMEGGGYSILNAIEIVRAVVKAFAAGKIRLEKPYKKVGIRIAPSFTHATNSASAEVQQYTPITIARFLGWANDKKGGQQPNHNVSRSLDFLELEQQGFLNGHQIRGLNRRETEALIAQTRAARDQAIKDAEQAKRDLEQAPAEEAEWEQKLSEATNATDRAMIEKVLESIRKGKVEAEETLAQPLEDKVKKVSEAVSEAVKKGEGDAQTRARKAAHKVTGGNKKKPAPDIEPFAEKFTKSVRKILGSSEKPSKLREHAEELIKFRDSLHSLPRDEAATALLQVGRDFIALSNRLRENVVKPAPKTTHKRLHREPAE